MDWVTTRATIKCDHDGKVKNVPSQTWVRVDTYPVLVDNDPDHRDVNACPNIGPTMKPCTNTITVFKGYSTFIRIGGHGVVLDNLDGLTDGTLPGTVHYNVRQPGQTYVAATS
jgi:hypothetical protein